jgi:hypothetical protein
MKVVNFVLVFSVTIAISYGASFLGEKKPKLFIALVLAFSAGLCIIWNIYARTVPISDYQVLWDNALSIARGTFDKGYDKTSYFYIYNFQMGYVSYLALITKVFGHSLSFFKVIEALYMAATVFMVYMILKRAKGIRTASVGAAVTAIYVFNIMGSSIINNQHLGALIMLIGIYFIGGESKASMAASGIAFGLMNVVRPIGIVLIAGGVIYFIYSLIGDRNWRKWTVKLLIFLFSFYITTGAFDLFFIKSGLTPTRISKSSIPYFKFVIGLGAENGSLFGNNTLDAEKTSVYFDLKDLNFDYDKYNSECLKFIKGKIANYRDTWNYVYQKMKMFSGEKDNQYYFALKEDMQSGRILVNLLDAAHLQYFQLLILGIIASISRIRKREDISLFNILFILFFAVHVFIEVQTRYRYELYLMMIIFASEEIAHLVSIIENALKAQKSKGEDSKQIPSKIR